MAASIVSNNVVLFNWATTVPYNVFLTNIQPDSTLPPKSARGEMASFYHALSAGDLTMMAYLAGANGVNLYAQGDYALRRLNMLVAGWVAVGGVTLNP